MPASVLRLIFAPAGPILLLGKKRVQWDRRSSMGTVLLSVSQDVVSVANRIAHEAPNDAVPVVTASYDSVHDPG